MEMSIEVNMKSQVLEKEVSESKFELFKRSFQWNSTMIDRRL